MDKMWELFVAFKLGGMKATTMLQVFKDLHFLSLIHIFVKLLFVLSVLMAP